MTIAYNANVVRSGLVLYLDAANVKSNVGDGNTIYDISGNSKDATIVNGIAFDPANGGYFVFDGVNEYLNITQPSISVSPNAWTICGWIKPNNQYSRFLTPQSNGIDQWIEYDNTNQKINVQITESADVNNRTRFGNNNTALLNTWSFFAVSINNLTIKIYANGVLTNTYTETIPIGDWTGTWILGWRGAGAAWFSGGISNLQAYNRELSINEISQNFNALRGRFGI